MSISAQARLRGAALLACAAVALLVLLLRHPPVVSCIIPEEIRLLVWPRAVMFGARWPLAVLCVSLAAASWRLTSIGPNDPATSARGLRALRPLAALPLLAVPLLIADLLPAAWPGNLLLFVPAVVISLALARILAGPAQTAAVPAHRDRRIAAALLAGSWALYFCVGLHVSRAVGEHIGDEGHYILIAQSLHDDGDLDIRNDVLRDLRFPEDAAVDFGFMHVAPNSRGKHWYSMHPFGLSLVLAPVWRGGLPARQALLALIGALSVVGAYALCRRAGAAPFSAGLACAVLGSGAYWTFYAARALPEMLGATLLVWTAWAFVAQRDRPWTATLLAAAACAYLPFAHTRFIPSSGAAAALFALHGLRCTAEPWPRRLTRLALFALLTGGGYACYLYIQHQMYAGGYYGADSALLFSFFAGAWGVIADRHGALSVFPPLFWFLPAAIAWAWIDRERRAIAGSCLALFFTTVLLLGTSLWYPGGSSFPGRYLVVVTPLLAPGAAIMLERAGGFGRWWLLFLATCSALLLVMVLAALPYLGREFIFPLEYLPREPLLHGLFSPYASLLYPAARASSRAWTTLFAAAGFLLTFAWLRWPRPARAHYALGLAGLIACGAIAHLAQYPPGARPPLRRDRLLRLLSEIRPERARFARRPTGPPLPVEHLLPPAGLAFPNGPQFLLTTEDLEMPQPDGRFSQPRLPVNDWDGRDLRWATLTRPFSPPRSEVLLQIEGWRAGTATAVLAVREGSRTYIETAMPMPEDTPCLLRYRVPLRGHSGHLYLLARLADGEGTLHLTRMTLMPSHPAMIHGWNLVLPEGIDQPRPQDAARTGRPLRRHIERQEHLDDHSAAVTRISTPR